MLVRAWVSTEMIPAIISPAIAHVDLGTIYAAQNHTAAAIQQFRAAIQCDPKRYDAHYRLALNVESRGVEVDSPARGVFAASALIASVAD